MSYFGYVLGAYIVSAIGLVGLIAWVVLDGRTQARALAELDRSGFRRDGGRNGGDLE